MSLRRELRQRLPSSLVYTLRAWPRQRRERQYCSQQLVRVSTASFRADESGTVRTTTERLSQICDDKTCFIKLDTDGYDFFILRDSIDFLASQQPAILFENQIRTVEDLDASNHVLGALSKTGYSGFVVWDDPGFHLVSTTAIEVLQDLNRYLFSVWKKPGHRSICNYDVLSRGCPSDC